MPASIRRRALPRRARPAGGRRVVAVGDAVLTDGRILALVVTMRDDTGSSIGNPFQSVDLTSIPVELMAFSVE
jgi:hypothetical protein